MPIRCDQGAYSMPLRGGFGIRRRGIHRRDDPHDGRQRIVGFDSRIKEVLSRLKLDDTAKSVSRTVGRRA